MNASHYSDNASEPEIVVRPNHRFAKGLLVIFLLTGLAVGGVSVISQFHNASQRMFFPLCIFVVLWLGAGTLTVFSLAWISSGAQVVSFFGDTVMLAYKIGARTVGKAKTFSAADIRNLRIEKRTYKVRGNIATKYAIAFDYLGKKRDLVTSLRIGDADSLLANLRARLES